MKRGTLIMLSAAFGLSGFAALTYQITWIKELGTFFGIQVYSTTTVLTAFMAGLALGSWIFGRIADRVRSPLLIFAFMELGIALFALLFPWIREIIAQLYLHFHRPEADGPVINQLIRFAVTFPFLLVATSMMGGTLPVLTKGVTKELERLGDHVSLLYGSNNLGAFLGGFATGYILIQTVGMNGALLIGAALNTLNGVLVFILLPALLKRPAEDRVYKTKKDTLRTFSIQREEVSPRLNHLVLWVFALEGFTTLAYEIIWTRIIHEFSYDKTSYFYTTIIIAFVGGLSIGSYILNRFISRLRSPLKMLARVEIGIGILYLILTAAFIAVAPVFHEFQEQQEIWFNKVVTEQLLIFLVVAPPVVLMGFTLPLVSVIYTSSASHIGQRMGILGSLDTIGSVAGSLVAGFVMIPLFGTLKSLMIVMAMNIILGLVLFGALQTSKAAKRSFSAVAIMILAAVFLVPPSIRSLNARWNIVLKDPILYYGEGPAASVAVTRFRNDHTALSINGAIVAYTIVNDVQLHKLLAALPYLYCETPQRALVVGLGIGITTDALVKARVPDIRVAEISPEVMKVSKKFFGFSYTDSEIPNPPEYHIEDGRALLFSSDDAFDIITSNSIHPRLGNSIYTREFYELCREKLSIGGMVCQWLPTNWMNIREIKTLIHSFTEVFPWSSLWFINDGHVILLGSNSAPQIDLETLQERFSKEPFREYMATSGFLGAPDVMKHYWLDSETLETWVNGVPLNTDDRPLIEFSRTVSRAPNTELLRYLAVEARLSEIPFSSAYGNRIGTERLNMKREELRSMLEQYILLIE